MIVSDRTSLIDTFSLHVPVTVMVLGPWGRAATAVLRLAPGQFTATLLACAITGSRKNVNKIANTETLDTPFSMANAPFHFGTKCFLGDMTGWPLLSRRGARTTNS